MVKSAKQAVQKGDMRTLYMISQRNLQAIIAGVVKGLSKIKIGSYYQMLMNRKQDGLFNKILNRSPSVVTFDFIHLKVMDPLL